MAGDTINRLPLRGMAVEAHLHPDTHERPLGWPLGEGDCAMARLAREMCDPNVALVREVHVRWQVEQLVEAQRVAAADHHRKACGLGAGALTHLVTHRADRLGWESGMRARGDKLMAEGAFEFQGLGVLAVVERHGLRHGGWAQEPPSPRGDDHDEGGDRQADPEPARRNEVLRGIENQLLLRLLEGRNREGPVKRH
jgi:hypothetical protein